MSLHVSSSPSSVEHASALLLDCHPAFRPMRRYIISPAACQIFLVATWTILECTAIEDLLICSHYPTNALFRRPPDSVFPSLGAASWRLEANRGGGLAASDNEARTAAAIAGVVLLAGLCLLV